MCTPMHAPLACAPCMCPLHACPMHAPLACTPHAHPLHMPCQFIIAQGSPPQTIRLLAFKNLINTRMHSSRMHTAHSSSHPGWCPPGTPCPQDETPLGPGTLPGPDPPPQDKAPPPREQTHTCKHITLPQTSFAGSNKTLSFPHHLFEKVTSNQNRSIS